MRRINTWLTTGFIFCNIFSFAQVLVAIGVSGEKSISERDYFFSALVQKGDEDPYASDITIKNSIKFCPTLLLRQKAALFYERALFGGLALNIGAGKAFGTDGIQTTYFTALSEFADSEVMWPSDVLLNSKFSGGSPLWSAGLKLYFHGVTFDEAYVELNYRNENVTYVVNPVVNDHAVTEGNDAIFKMNAFSIGCGYMHVSRNNRFTHEFFINFGFKDFKFTKFSLTEITSASGETEKVYVRTQEELSTRLVPSVNIGYSFGVGF